jgi:hypothetical protein
VRISQLEEEVTREITSRVCLSAEKDEISRQNASLLREMARLVPLTNEYDGGDHGAVKVQGVASRVQWKLQHVIGVLRHVHGALCRSSSPAHGDVGVIWHRAHDAVIGKSTPMQDISLPKTWPAYMCRSGNSKHISPWS